MKLLSNKDIRFYSNLRGTEGDHATHMRVFGCIAYAMVPDVQIGKLDAKNIKYLFWGYCEGIRPIG